MTLVDRSKQLPFSWVAELPGHHQMLSPADLLLKNADVATQSSSVLINALNGINHNRRRSIDGSPMQTPSKRTTMLSSPQSTLTSPITIGSLDSVTLSPIQRPRKQPRESLLAQDIMHSTAHIRKVANRASLDSGFSLQSHQQQVDESFIEDSTSQPSADPQLLSFLASLLTEELVAHGEMAPSSSFPVSVLPSSADSEHSAQHLTLRHLISMLARSHKIIAEKEEQIMKSASVGQMLLESNSRMADSIEQMKSQIEEMEQRRVLMEEDRRRMQLRYDELVEIQRSLESSRVDKDDFQIMSPGRGGANNNNNSTAIDLNESGSGAEELLTMVHEFLASELPSTITLLPPNSAGLASPMHSQQQHQEPPRTPATASAAANTTASMLGSPFASPAPKSAAPSAQQLRQQLRQFHQQLADERRTSNAAMSSLRTQLQMVEDECRLQHEQFVFFGFLGLLVQHINSLMWRITNAGTNLSDSDAIVLR